MGDNLKKTGHINPPVRRSTEVNDIHTPHVKMEFGKTGETEQISALNGLPIAMPTLQDSIDDLVIQMRINNAYMAMGFDEIITEEDIT